jgi:hypothetical protein
MHKIPRLPRSILNVLRGSKDPYGALSKIRREVDPALYPALAGWMPNLAQKQRHFSAGHFPATIGALTKERRILHPVGYANEILWSATVLAEHARRLTTFGELRQTFEIDFLSGNYEEANSGLDRIQNLFGYSFWLIESRIALLQCWKGLEGQKAFANSVKDSEAPKLVSYFAYLVSQRNEETTNPYRFKAQVTDQTSGWRSHEEFGAYILYRIADIIPNSRRMIGAVLRMEAISSVIDQFETFVRLATHAVTAANEFASAYAAALPRLRTISSDPRLRKLLFLTAPDIHDLSDMSFLESDAGDSLLSEDYLGAANWGPIQRRDVDELLLSAKAYAEAGSAVDSPRDMSLAGRLASLAERLVSKHQEDESYIDAVRMALNLRFTSFINPFVEFASSQMTDVPVPARQTTLTSFVHSRMLNPRALFALSPPAKGILATLVSNCNTLACQAELFRANLDDSPPRGASDYVKLALRADRALLGGDFDTALQMSRLLRDSPRPSTVRDSLRLEAYTLLKLGDAARAIEVVVDGYLMDPKVLRMLPIAGCVKALNKTLAKQVAGRLSAPIVLDLFTRFIDDSRVSQRRYAYDDFLLANGMTRPSDLRSRITDFNRAQLVYYLRYVCVPQVMEISISFESSHEVEDERLTVCGLLMEIDPANANAYEAEIREITKKQVIQGGIRQVEQSKVSIDLEPVRRWAEKNLKDSFMRYQALFSAGIRASSDTDSISSSNLLDEPPPSRTMPDTRDKLPEMSQELPDVPANEAVALLLNMVSALLRECYLDPFHGLDCSLSMRIRHGALSGQLRAPLEEEHLITQRESGSGEYFPNEHWARRLSYIGSARLTQLDVLLREFSRDYDVMINSFTKDQIQIHSVDKKDGLFTASVRSTRLGLLVHEIRDDTTFDNFLDLCFTVFWESVDASLEAVRDYIDKVLKPKLRQMFLALMTNVDAITAEIPSAELNNAIRNAQTQAHNALDQVKDWFRQTKALPPRSCEFQELVEIGLQQVRKINHDFDPQLTTEIDPMPRFGDLSRFSDIFFIVFANIWKHSQIARPKVHVSAKLSGVILTIDIENDVESTSVTPSVRTRVDGIKATIEHGGYQRAVRSEGGTGLIKLRNILPRDDAGKSQLDFGFRQSDSFFVTARLPVNFYKESLESPE